MTITIKKYPHNSAAKKDIGKPREPSGSKSNIVYYNKREQILRILQLYVLRKISFRILREYYPSS